MEQQATPSSAPTQPQHMPTTRQRSAAAAAVEDATTTRQHNNNTAVQAQDQQQRRTQQAAAIIGRQAAPATGRVTAAATATITTGTTPSPPNTRKQAVAGTQERQEQQQSPTAVPTPTAETAEPSSPPSTTTSSVIEEEEPKLKYQRLGASVALILRTDSARCLVAHDKFLILGTASGRIHLLDFVGNEIKRFQVHKAAINGLCVDAIGDFAATCSDDGTVVITNLFEEEQARYNYGRAPVNAVALCANYGEGSIFAAGGNRGQLIINTKGWFSNKDNVIHAGEGPIHAIAWGLKTNLLAWANDLGVKVFDCTTQAKVTYMERPNDQWTPPPSAYRCHLVWSAPDTLVVGWGNFIQIGIVDEAPVAGHHGTGIHDGTGVNAHAVRRFVKLQSIFRTSYLICGVVPFEDNLAVLAFVQPEEEDGDDKGEEEEQKSTTAETKEVEKHIQHEGNRTATTTFNSKTARPSQSLLPAVLSKQKRRRPALRPEVNIITWDNDELSSDALPIHGFENYTADHYRLEYLPGAERDDAALYIVSPQDIVVARPRDLDDHVSWYVSRGMHGKALTAAQENPSALKTHQILELSERYLKHLMEIGEYDTAAQACPSLLGQSAELWDAWIAVFAKNRHLKTIAPYIPTENPRLSHSVYEIVLLYFLVEDHAGFLRTVKTWSPDMYNVDHVITAVTDRLNISSSSSADLSGVQGSDLLLEALSHLYVIKGDFSKALHVFLRLGRVELFDTIRAHGLYEWARDKVLALMAFNYSQAIRLFVGHAERFRVDSIVEQLKDHPKLQHKYLHALYEKDMGAGERHHELQVSLYAKYAPNDLLGFLRNTSGDAYRLEDALQVCKDHRLYNEMVYLLERMGNAGYALTLIIEKLRDVRRAIAFVEEQRDESLWEDLITRSIDNPLFLSDLLEHVGFHNVDLSQLIRRIPDELEIPRLKEKLVKIMIDSLLQKSVRNECNAILQRDCVTLQERLYKQRRCGMRVAAGARCSLCEGGILLRAQRGGDGAESGGGGITVFFCKHMYHRDCLETHLPHQRRGDIAVPVAPVCVKCAKQQLRSHAVASNGGGTRSAEPQRHRV